jgi:hypothetical protein
MIDWKKESEEEVSPTTSNSKIIFWLLGVAGLEGGKSGPPERLNYGHFCQYFFRAAKVEQVASENDHGHLFFVPILFLTQQHITNIHTGIITTMSRNKNKSSGRDVTDSCFVCRKHQTGNGGGGRCSQCKYNV